MKKHFSEEYMTTLLYIGATMLALLGLLGAVLKGIVEREGLAIIQRDNNILLNEVGYHIGYMNDINMKLCSMQFNDSDTRILLTADKELDLFLSNNVMDRIRRSLVVSGMTDSVILYNGTMDKFYYTDAYLYRIDDEMMDFLRTNREKKAVYMIPRILEGRKLFSYVMCSRRSEDYSVETAVVLNVSADWMLSNFAVAEVSGEGLMLVDDEGLVLLDTDGAVGEYHLDGEMFSRILEEMDSSFIQEINGVKTVISHRRIEGTKWRVISCQPYSTLYHMVDQVRTKILLTIAAVLLLAVIVAFALARRVTNPLRTLFWYVQRNGTKKAQEDISGRERQKEAEFLMDIFEAQQEQISQFRDFKESVEISLQKAYLKNMLLENGTGVYQPIEKLAGSNYQNFSEGEQILMVLLTIANLKNLDKENATERNLIRFVVCNIANEILEQYGVREVLPMSGGEVVILLGWREQGHDRALLRKLLNEVAENADKLVNIMVSSFVCEMEFGQANLAPVYRQLREISRYTLIHGVKCVLFPQDVEEQRKNMLRYPEELEKKLLDEVTEVKAEDARETLLEFLAYLEDGSIENYFACVNKLVLSFQTYVEKLNQHRLIKIQIEWDESLKQLQESESSEQVYKLLCGMLQNAMEQMPSSVQQKNSALIEGVKAYIENHYSDKELCGKKLAGEFGLSTAYLGMLFKEWAGCGLQEYINRVRLENAGVLVQQTDLLIGEIMEQCGFESSSFYRLYKAYYGVTPKEQRMRSKLAKRRET